jgi:galactonate dehydratase
MARSTATPIYQYLGGPTRFKARVLAHLEGSDENSLAAPLQRAMRQGFKAFTVPIPGRDAMWRMQAYVDSVRRRVEWLRGIAGPEADVVLDAGGGLTPGDAAFIATALEKDHLLWLDEPSDAFRNDTLSKITDESVMPLGLGRKFHNVTDFQNLLRWGCIDVLRPSAGLNSIAKIRRMAAVAETHYIAVAPYHDGGPIASVAAIHLAASLPNFFIQQIPMPASDRDAAMRAELTSGDQEVARDGFALLLNKPGLGIQVNEQALNKYSEETV